MASVFSLTALSAQAGMRGPIPSGKTKSEESPATGLIQFYQRYISPVDGDRCQMEPGCSQYARESIAHYGLVKGIVISADRIMRCGNDLDLYQRVWREYRHRFLDEPGSCLLRKKE